MGSSAEVSSNAAPTPLTMGDFGGRLLGAARSVAKDEKIHRPRSGWFAARSDSAMLAGSSGRQARQHIRADHPFDVDKLALITGDGGQGDRDDETRSRELPLAVSRVRRGLTVFMGVALCQTRALLSNQVDETCASLSYGGVNGRRYAG